VAVEDVRTQVGHITQVHLGANQRYRCLIFQSAALESLSMLRRTLCDALSQAGMEPFVHDASEQFDSKGAMACADVIARLEESSRGTYQILAGPLHFLDYWSASLRDAFWSHLATFTRGPGLIVLDTPRESELDGMFKILGRIGKTDIRYLKSRLAAIQDRML